MWPSGQDVALCRDLGCYLSCLEQHLAYFLVISKYFSVMWNLHCKMMGNVPPGNKRMSQASHPCLEAHVLCSLVWCGCNFSVRDTNSLNTISKAFLELEDFGVGL